MDIAASETSRRPHERSQRPLLVLRLFEDPRSSMLKDWNDGSARFRLTRIGTAACHAQAAKPVNRLKLICGGKPQPEPASMQSHLFAPSPARRFKAGVRSFFAQKLSGTP